MTSRGAIDLIESEESPLLTRMIRVMGVDFDEVFLADLIAEHFKSRGLTKHPRLTDALTIYLNESDAADGRKFRGDALHVVNRFVCLLGDLKLSELRHIHACMFRDHLLKQGLKPVTVRKQAAILNAMINVAFKHLDVDRLSPFRSLKISGDDSPRPMRVVTRELLVEVKNRLLTKPTQFKYVGLLQLNTGLRLSEPVFARLEDCVLNHPIPHLWIRRNELSKRKNKSSIRAVPLVGVSLHAAEMLAEIAIANDSEWLVPQYAHYHGSNSCSAVMNKHMADLDFRTHMFRHSLIDRMKAINSIPVRLAESITGHSSGGSEFNNYGTVGYTLEQKLEVLRTVAV